MLLASLPVILSGSLRGRAADDSINYHEKAIRQFAQELPNPKLKDYLSATTPGYHLVLAGVGRTLADIGADGRSAYDTDLTPILPDPKLSRERRVLQLVGLGFTLAMLYMVGCWVQRRLEANPLEPGPLLAAVVLCLPLIGSPYIYQSAAWLVPDNSAWLGVAAILMLALRPRIGLGTLICMGLVLVWLVAARQVHAWAAGLVWAAAWLSASMPADRDGTAGPFLSASDLLSKAGAQSTAARVVLGMLCTFPAIAMLGWLWVLWGKQLVPPSFVNWHGSTVQTATPAFILALVTIVSPFFASWLWPGLVRAWRDRRGTLLMAALVGLLLATIPPTLWGFERGRFGGVWSLYAYAGQVGDRSLALIVLAPLGAMVVTSALSGVGVRERWIMLAALAGFAVANSANPQLWQRYHEPFVLLWLIVASALIARRAERPDAPGCLRAWKLTGPTCLALLLGAINAVTTLRSQEMTDKGYRPGHIAEMPAQTKP